MCNFYDKYDTGIRNTYNIKYTVPDFEGVRESICESSQRSQATDAAPIGLHDPLVAFLIFGAD